MANTLATRKQSEAIRDRMQAIRCRLPYRADAAREHVRQLTDWKHHFRMNPWPALGLSAVVGYLAVPAHRKVLREDQRERVIVSSDAHPPQQQGHITKRGLMGGLAGAVATMALRTGVSIAARHVSESLFGDRSDAVR